MKSLQALLSALVRDDRGRLSHSKLWSNVAYAVATWIVIELTLRGGLNIEYFISYLAIAGGHSSLSKYITNKSEVAKE